MKLKFLGAARTVTGSRILFEHNHFVGLIDCGLFQGPKELRKFNWEEQPDLQKAQCVILTHVHIDHSGYLPRLHKNGFNKKIYCTKPSADLLPVMLLDSAKLQVEDAEYANRTKHSAFDPALPLYDEKDARGTIELIHGVEWNNWQVLTPFLSFRFLRSGHILGSGLVQLQFLQNDKTYVVTLTGDLGGGHSEIILDPENISNSDFLVMESTYGNRSVDRSQIHEQLTEIINKVHLRKGTLIIPAFSLGRTQDLLFLIHQLKKNNKIGNIPVYLDSPMSNTVTHVYRKNEDELKINFRNEDLMQALSVGSFKPVTDTNDSMLLCMSDESKIVISASGMLQGGRVLHHLRCKLPDAKNGVLFVGYLTPETKGRLLKNGLSKIRIHHKLIDVEAEIFSLDGLSAHADSDELLQWCSNFRNPPKLTLINHGEYEASQALAYRLKTELQWSAVQIPEQYQEIVLEP